MIATVCMNDEWVEDHLQRWLFMVDSVYPDSPIGVLVPFEHVPGPLPEELRELGRRIRKAVPRTVVKYHPYDPDNRLMSRRLLYFDVLRAGLHTQFKWPEGKALMYLDVDIDARRRYPYETVLEGDQLFGWARNPLDDPGDVLDTLRQNNRPLDWVGEPGAIVLKQALSADMIAVVNAHWRTLGDFMPGSAAWNMLNVPQARFDDLFHANWHSPPELLTDTYNLHFSGQAKALRSHTSYASGRIVINSEPVDGLHLKI